MRRPVKILHIITGLGPGGAERSLVKLIESSNKSLFEHYVVSLLDRPTYVETLKNLGANIYELKLKKATSFLFGIRKIKTIAKHAKPDLIHGWMYYGSLISLFALPKTPKIMGVRHSLHNIKYEKPATRLTIKILSLLSRKFNSIVYNAEISRRQHEKYGFYKNRGTTIPNGFDVNYLKPDHTQRQTLRTKMNVDINTVLLGNISRYHPMKNHKGILNAFGKLLSFVPKSKLILVGSGLTPENSEIYEHINDLNIKEKVILWGPTTDIPAILSAMDVFVLSSSWGEGFPNVLGEAMACKLPCVTTDIGDSACIVDDTGIVVPPDRPILLMEAMRKIAEKPESDRKNLGEMARQRIIDHFQQRKVTEEYEAIYQKLYENR